MHASTLRRYARIKGAAVVSNAFGRLRCGTTVVGRGAAGRGTLRRNDVQGPHVAADARNPRRIINPIGPFIGKDGSRSATERPQAFLLTALIVPSETVRADEQSGRYPRAVGECDIVPALTHCANGAPKTDDGSSCGCAGDWATPCCGFRAGRIIAVVV